MDLDGVGARRNEKFKTIMFSITRERNDKTVRVTCYDVGTHDVFETGKKTTVKKMEKDR